MESHGKSNAKENSQRAVGDLVLIFNKKHERSYTLEKPTEGPCEITAVHDNGHVTISRGAYKECICIRRIKPYHNASEQQN